MRCTGSGSSDCCLSFTASGQCSDDLSCTMPDPNKSKHVIIDNPTFSDALFYSTRQGIPVSWVSLERAVYVLPA